jgi:hypothetical protein
MKFNISLFLLYFFLTNTTTVFAQEKGTGPKEKSWKTERKIRKKAKLEARDKKLKEKAEKKAIKKHHKRLQTKQVRKRMKNSKNRANLNNDNRREPFYKRIIKKKKQKK